MSVTTYLKGGCANQLFQYAAGLALARRLGTDLRIDNSRYDSPGEWRMYSLGLFRGVTEPVVKHLSGAVYREQGLPYDGAFWSRQGECSIDGYWQTEKYIDGVKDEMRSRLEPRLPLASVHGAFLGQIQACENSVFLTVRRTDYVTTPFHGLLPAEYYRQATDFVASWVHDPTFFVFSDEPGWCEANLDLGRYRKVVAGNYDMTAKPHLGREDAELLLMRSCRHAIMANSSYSWWGAWLGRADMGGLVVAPKQWFGPSADADPRDIVPERWTRI